MKGGDATVKGKLNVCGLRILKLFLVTSLFFSLTILGSFDLKGGGAWGDIEDSEHFRTELSEAVGGENIPVHELNKSWNRMRQDKTPILSGAGEVKQYFPDKPVDLLFGPNETDSMKIHQLQMRVRELERRIYELEKRPYFDLDPSSSIVTPTVPGNCR